MKFVEGQVLVFSDWSIWINQL